MKRFAVLSLGVLLAGSAWAGGKTIFGSGFSSTPASITSPSEVVGSWRDEAQAFFVHANVYDGEVRAILIDTSSGQRFRATGRLQDGAIVGRYGPESTCLSGGAATGDFALHLQKTAKGEPVLDVRAGVSKLAENTSPRINGKVAHDLADAKAFCR